MVVIKLFLPVLNVYNLDLLFRNQECILLLDYIILLVFCIKRKTNGRLYLSILRLFFQPTDPDIVDRFLSCARQAIPYFVVRI